MLDDLRKFRMIYLATPYTKHSEGVEYAFLYASGMVANLVARGVTKVYSPIVHWHTPTVLDAQNVLRRFNSDQWFDLNKPMMDTCDCMVIPDESGSQYENVSKSEGIAKERAYFEAKGKPVVIVDFVSMKLAA